MSVALKFEHDVRTWGNSPTMLRVITAPFASTKEEETSDNTGCAFVGVVTELILNCTELPAANAPAVVFRRAVSTGIAPPVILADPDAPDAGCVKTRAALVGNERPDPASVMTSWLPLATATAGVNTTVIKTPEVLRTGADNVTAG